MYIRAEMMLDFIRDLVSLVALPCTVQYLPHVCMYAVDAVWPSICFFFFFFLRLFFSALLFLSLFFSFALLVSLILLWRIQSPSLSHPPPRGFHVLDRARAPFTEGAAWLLWVRGIRAWPVPAFRLAPSPIPSFASLPPRVSRVNVWWSAFDRLFHPPSPICHSPSTIHHTPSTRTGDKMTETEDPFPISHLPTSHGPASSLLYLRFPISVFLPFRLLPVQPPGQRVPSPRISSSGGVPFYSKELLPSRSPPIAFCNTFSDLAVARNSNQLTLTHFHINSIL